MPPVFGPLTTLPPFPLSPPCSSFCYYSRARDWDNPYRNKEFPETASISAEGYYLIGLKGYPEEDGNPDVDWQIYESRQLSNIGGSIAIFPWDPSEKTASEAHLGVVDVVAWSNVENVIEGEPFEDTIGIDKSIQRNPIGQDTDDNNTDFELQRIHSPINSNGEEKIPGTFVSDETVISENTTWTIAGSPYYLEVNSGERPIIDEGATLTIEPGVVIMPMGHNYTALEVRGTLIAEGTEDEKIVFTSIKDEDYGGTGSASAGDWMNMVFTSTSTDSSLKNVIFRYGGDRTGLHEIYTEMIRVDNSSIEMEDVIMENSESRAMHLIDSNSKIKKSIFRDSRVGILIVGSSETSVIEDSVFENNFEYGLDIRNEASPIIRNNQFLNNGYVATLGVVFLHSAYPQFENNQASNNNLNGIVVDSDTILNQDTTWQADLPYILIPNSGEFPTVASGSTLTLEPGVILKPYGSHYTALLVEGTLIAEAATGSEIVFTSLKDDSFGGDTNNDGDTTVPAAGDWHNIVFAAGSSGSVLDNVFFYYGSVVPVVVEPGAGVEVKDVDYEP